MNAEPTTIEERAAAWLIRLDSAQIGAAERADFNAWLEANPRHRVAFLRQQVAWRKVDKLRALGSSAQLFDDEALNGLKAGWRAHGFALAAAIVLLLAGAAVWQAMYPFGWKTYSTALGNSERIVLADGSVMVLNTDSAARVRMNSSHRSIVLLRGEGLFEVARDSRRSFEVQASDTTVQALGTAFSVRLHDSKQVEVLVSEGRVALSSSALESAQGSAQMGPHLSAGDAVTVRPEGLQLKRLNPEEIPRKLAWRQGLLRFNGETLVEAVAEFNRYNREQLTIVDPAIAELHVGGGFQTTDLTSFLGALEKSFGIRADRTGSETTPLIRLTGAAQPN